MSLPVDGEVHELRLGQTFDSHPKTAFHSFRYDFKPASVDISKEARVEIGDGHQVTVTVPHVEGAVRSHTVFKGNKKPMSKECVLIIDHDTGTYTLEKLDQSVFVKKTRFEGSSSKGHRPTTPVDTKKLSPKSIKTNKTTSPPPLVPDSPSVTPLRSEIDKDEVPLIGDLSSDSSDGSASSSDDEMVEVAPAETRHHFEPLSQISITTDLLKDDLDLSETGSDSD